MGEILDKKIVHHAAYSAPIVTLSKNARILSPHLLYQARNAAAVPIHHLVSFSGLCLMTYSPQFPPQHKSCAYGRRSKESMYALCASLTDLDSVLSEWSTKVYVNCR